MRRRRTPAIGVGSDVGGFGKGQRIIDIYSEAANSALDFRVAEKDLDGSEIARPLMDQRCLGTTNGVRAVLCRVETDRPHGAAGRVKTRMGSLAI